MAKYIDEEAIIFAYREEEVAAQYDGRNDITSGVLFVLDTISEMPESIVRCKDCRYWDDDRRCNGIKNGLVLEYTDEDDFCSYGERRDDNA